ncbi:sensor histidine kinase [Bacillus sp. Marseille-P3800]|uniref:sensor histidine kinase n=1 Tax=Bacillus sp. Marseille-P3800 TaxID=2014782 RepID=UPI000C088E52|nr:sensor histidine kinase [Bacillus sp. Marseille-P3800]
MRSIINWRKREHRIFNRILLMYSIIIVLVISLLVLFIVRFISNDVINRSLEDNSEKIKLLEDYVIERDQALSTNVRELYFYPELIESISVALQNEPGTYLEFRLEQYAGQRSFVPSNVESFLRSFYYTDNTIDGIVLTSSNGEQEYSYIFHYANWSRYHSNHHNLKGLTLSRPINDGVSTSNIGYLEAFYDLGPLYEAVNYQDESIGLVQLYDKEGTLLFTSEESQSLLTFPDEFYSMTEQGYSEIKHNGEHYYYKTFVDTERSLIYAGVVPRSEISGLTLLYSTVIAILFGIASITVLVGYFVMRSYAKRIYQIQQSMKRVENGDLTTRIDLSRQNQRDELGVISVRFNRMLDELNEYINQSYILKMRNQKAEMMALQAQMNPHFLYNTLESIRMKAAVEGAKDASNMTFHLAKILRYTLSDSQYASLNEELEHVSQYMELMKYRYKDKLKVSYSIAPALLNQKVLRLSLQPLAENYMKHGFVAEQSTNQFSISVKESFKELIFTISDNGKGIEASKIIKVREQLDSKEYDQSIGLRNIHKRVQLQHGNSYGVEVESVFNEGTTITITIPKDEGGRIDATRHIG